MINIRQLHKQEYEAWKNMRQRCNNPNRPQYKDWGGRGITVCKRWDSFANFLADMGTRPKGMSLDRKDNNKGYSKSNCRWATRTEQAVNRRMTIGLFTYQTETKTLAEWSRDSRCVVTIRTLVNRVRTGWLFEQALTTPRSRGSTGPKQFKGLYTHMGETKSLHEWTKDSRCKPTRSTLYLRVRKGIPFEEALTTQGEL